MFFFQALDFTSRNGVWYSWKNGPVLLSIFPQKMGSLETWSTELRNSENISWIPIFWGPNCGTGKDEDRSGRTGLDEEGVVGSFRNCLVKDSSRWKGFKRFQCNVLFFFSEYISNTSTSSEKKPSSNRWAGSNFYVDSVATKGNTLERNTTNSL